MSTGTPSTEPDPRVSYANERTLLAWTPTSLGRMRPPGRHSTTPWSRAAHFAVMGPQPPILRPRG